jgi:hypothetical protein
VGTAAIANARKTEYGAQPFLTHLEVRAAPFALKDLRYTT